MRQDTGRPGMSYWMIFVLLLMKQALNIDFDRLTELANQHQSLRQMLQLDLLGGQPIRLKRQASSRMFGECVQLATHPCDDP